MPSSFSRVVSSTLGYSPRPPVSVYGTGTYLAPLVGFPGVGTRISISGRSLLWVRYLRLAERGFAVSQPYLPSAVIHYLLYAVPRVTTSVVTLGIWFGIINPIVISYASRPRLSPRLTPGGLSLPGNPWTYGVRVFHPHFRILMPAFSFPVPPIGITTYLPRPAERSPTTHY